MSACAASGSSTWSSEVLMLGTASSSASRQKRLGLAESSPSRTPPGAHGDPVAVRGTGLSNLDRDGQADRAEIDQADHEGPGPDRFPVMKVQVEAAPKRWMWLTAECWLPVRRAARLCSRATTSMKMRPSARATTARRPGSRATCPPPGACWRASGVPTPSTSVRRSLDGAEASPRVQGQRRPRGRGRVPGTRFSPRDPRGKAASVGCGGHA